MYLIDTFVDSWNNIN